MDRKPYEITDLAGTHVAGRRIENRDAPLRLTDAEAAYELQLGAIRPWSPKPHPAMLHVNPPFDTMCPESQAAVTSLVEAALKQLGDQPPEPPIAPTKRRSKRR